MSRTAIPPDQRDRRVIPGPRVVLLPAGIAALVLAVLGGLARFGVAPADTPASAVESHGALVVLGFFGVLIGVERAVALRARWGFACPVLGAAGSVALVVAGDAVLAGWVWSSAGLVGLAITAGLMRRRPTSATACMVLSCAAWATSAAAWSTGAPLRAVVALWAAFLVLMITGERIQFGRLAARRSARPVVAVLACVLVTGLVTALAGDEQVGVVIVGAAFVVLGAWFVLVDRHGRERTPRPGLPRYVATWLRVAHAWLVGAGALWIIGAEHAAGPASDAALHALFQGFVLGMVLAHAPMVFPAVTGIRIPFHPVLYAPTALAHTGLAVRVAGDLGGSFDAARAGALVSALGLAAFLVVLLVRAVVALTYPSALARVDKPRSSV